MAIELLFEGQHADDAARELVDASGSDVEVLSVDTPPVREPVIIVVAAVVGIAVGVTQLADTIMKWHDRWSDRSSDKQAMKVIVVHDGKRRLLSRLTREELATLLAAEHDKPV